MIYKETQELMNSPTKENISSSICFTFARLAYTVELFIMFFTTKQTLTTDIILQCFVFSK